MQKISQQTEKHFLWLILIMLIVSFFANYFFLNQLQKFESIKNELVVAPFRLNEKNASYTLSKDSTGTYSVKYEKDDQIFSALIGSTQIPLDQFDGKRIIIQGEFRPIYGIPTCHNICLGNYRAPVIDVMNIELAEN